MHDTVGAHFLKLAKFLLPLYLKAPEYYYRTIIQNTAGYGA